jgi:predicted ATPase
MGSREVRGSAFVGREEELRLLEAELGDATAGRGRLVAIAGDPGIGKTRVVEEFIARASLPPGCVVWGPCSEHPGAPPYWPWQQAIRAYADTDDGAHLPARRHAGLPLHDAARGLRQ